MRIFEKWLMYISSYAPLYILLIIKEYKEIKKMVLDIILSVEKGGFTKLLRTTEFWFFFLLFFFLFLSACIVLKIIFLKGNRTIKIPEGIQNSGDSIISYIMTYIVPMLSVNSSEGQSLVLNIILFFIIGVLYVANDLLYLNPLLAILGYRYYLADSNQLIISRMKISELKSARANGNNVYVYEITENIIIYKGIRKI